MADENTSTALAEVAAETYGERFQGEARDRLPKKNRDHFESVDEALSVVKANRDNAPEQPKKAIRAEPAPSTNEDSAAAPEVRWSDQDLADLETFRGTAHHASHAAQQFAARYQKALADVGARNFEELRENDPAEAAALQQDFRPIWQATQQVQQMRNQITAALHERQLAATAEQLHRDLPDLERRKDEFIDWCAEQGYTREQVLAETDPERIKLAFRAFKAETKGAKAPKFRKKAPRVPKKPDNSAADRARDRLRSTGSIVDAVELLKARRKSA